MTTILEEEIAKLDALAAEQGETVEVEDDESEASDSESAESEDGNDDGGETVVDEKAEEPAKEVAKEEPKKVELKVDENLPEATAWYKLRQAQKEIEALKAAKEEPKAPAKEENYEGFIEHNLEATKAELAELKAWQEQQEEARLLEQQREAAFNELRAYEAEAEQAFPDYQAASNHAKAIIAASIKVLEPNLTQAELAQKTLYKYAEQAARALQQKKHPGQAIYELAHQMGYKKQEEKPKIEIKKPNLDTLAKNKQKSSGMHNNGGNGKAFVGADEFLKMSNADRMKLSESDWARLESESA